jgi:hypothetical protein
VFIFSSLVISCFFAAIVVFAEVTPILLDFKASLDPWVYMCHRFDIVFFGQIEIVQVPHFF